MSPSTEPKPARRRKSKPKPKFEVPKEVTASKPAAWVYRHDADGQPEASPPIPISPALKAVLPASTIPSAASPKKPPVDGVDPTMVMLAAIETMAITVASANRMFMAAASLMGAPIEVTRKILGL